MHLTIWFDLTEKHRMNSFPTRHNLLSGVGVIIILIIVLPVNIDWSHICELISLRDNGVNY